MSPNRNTDWYVAVPVDNLEITASIGERVAVGSVEFMSRSAWLSLVAPSGTASAATRPAIVGHIHDAEAFAVVQASGTWEDVLREAYPRIREAAYVLAATTAFYLNRKSFVGFALRGLPQRTGKSAVIVATDLASAASDSNKRGHLLPLSLDTDWQRNVTTRGTIAILDTIVDGALDAAWRRQVTSAAAFIGRSIMALELTDAFLYNVFALETMLTKRGERSGRKLTERIVGLTGWYLQTHRANYQNEIESIHRVRCEIVHDSDYSNLTPELLFLSDLYSSNILLNICLNRHMFPDKQALQDQADAWASSHSWPSDDSLKWVGSVSFSPGLLALDLW